MRRSTVQSTDGVSVAEPGSHARRLAPSGLPSVTLDLYASLRPDRGSILTSRMCDQHLMGTYQNLSPPLTAQLCQVQGHPPQQQGDLQPHQQGTDGTSSGEECEAAADAQFNKGIPNKATGATPESPMLCVDIWQQLKLQRKVFSDIVRRKPWVLLVPLLLCCLLCGLGVFGVVFAADRHVTSQRAYAREALASTTANAIAGQLEIATFAVMSLSTYLTQEPECSTLDRKYEALASRILSWDAKKLVYQIQALPAAALEYVYPPVDAELAKILMGRDMLGVPMYREVTLAQIRARDERLLIGPYRLLEGFMAMFVSYPIFLPAPNATFDWGCNRQPTDCPPGVCWLPEEGLKLWGLALGLISLDHLEEDFRFQVLTQQHYLYRLRQLPDASNAAAVISSSAQLPRDPVTATIHKFNLVWVLEVAPEGGWEPRWRDPCLAAVVVGSCLVCCLVLWLLVTREKHTMLLRAMLPRKVIRRLQRGEQTVVEEFPEPVTILFSDIVSYTEVASQLTPLQVVRLLNDLYTEFDTLTDKHGVYKVETIGDAFMCVSGCPIREDPVAAAVRMAGMAADMVACVQRFRSAVGAEELAVKIRIGLHSGPVVAGVIGQRMPRYCLFGDTVNTASRMETNSAPMCIHVSDTTADLLLRGGVRLAGVVQHPPPALSSGQLQELDHQQQQQQQQEEERRCFQFCMPRSGGPKAPKQRRFAVHARGLVDIKGKGIMSTFWLTPETEDLDSQV